MGWTDALAAPFVRYAATLPRKNVFEFRGQFTYLSAGYSDRIE